MEPGDIAAAQSTQIRSFLAAEGVDASYEVFVVRHVMAPDSTWRWCCGSNCDPCVERLGRVVDHTRRLLCIPDPGVPPAIEPQ